MDPKELREKINKLGTDMQGLLSKARDEKRELTPDEERSFDKMDDERNALIVKEKRALRIAELENPEERRTEQRPPTNESRQKPAEERATPQEHLEAVRAWIQAGSDIPLTTKQVATAQRLGVNPAVKKLVIQFPNFHLRSLRQTDFDRYEQRALSTLATTSPEDGNYLLANEMMAPLERALLEFGSVRQAATIRRTKNGNPWPWPTNDDTSNKGYLLAENTQTVKKDPAFGQMVLNSFKFSSKEVVVSRELMQDSNENLGDFLGSILGERIGRITEDYFTTGTGTSEPKGIVTAASNSNVQLAAQTPTYAEMVSIQHSVDPAYRRRSGAGWMFADSMLAEIKKIIDASTGRPIWMPSMIGSEPETILGKPYFINQSMAAAAGSGAGKSILFGDLSKYIIRDVKDVELFRLDELYAEYYQVAFVAFSRHDGDLLDAGTHPVKYALNKA